MNLQSKFSLFVLLLWMCSAQARKLKLCVVKCKFTHSIINEICPNYEPAHAEVGCVIATDRLACMSLVVSGVADFTVSEPEDLVVAIENLEYHIMVTHEIRLSENDTAKTQMIALMHSDFDDISNVKNSKLCYPGFDSSNLYNKYYTSYFEKRLIPRECDPHKSLLENRISSLANYFEAACIAGAWSLDSIFDTQLKSKYKNLCALCENPLGCYSDDKYYGEEGALICLTENVGDIAWTRWSSTDRHFTVEDIKKEDFNYICSDGSVRSFTSEKCAWVGEPWPVLIARADVAEQVSQLILRLIIKNERFLRLLGNLNVNKHIIKLQQMVTPDTYLQRFSAYTDAVSPYTCYPPREVRWCVTSNVEYRKCEAMRSAAYAYNIYPQIFCVQEASRKFCMNAIREKYADVFVIKPDEELDARNYGLKAILHMLSNNRDDLNTIGALVKKKSKFHSFKDLKNAKACFTGYRSVGWNAVVAKIINSTDLEVPCSDVKVISNYFGQSCVYGVNSSNMLIPDKLRSLCNESRGNHLFDEYNNNDPDIMALKCLAHVGDVAFVNISHAKEFFQQHGKYFGQTYKPLCVDESETNCFLTWTSLSLIMVHENITSLVEDETREMILSLDRFFGITGYSQTPLLSLYGPFFNKTNVIFSQKTKHLHREVSHVRNGKSYTDILSILIKHQKSCNTANPICTNNVYIHVINCIFTIYFMRLY